MEHTKSYLSRQARKQSILSGIYETLDGLADRDREEAVVDIVNHYGLIEAFVGVDLDEALEEGEEEPTTPRRRGRPKGSKNKPKVEATADATGTGRGRYVRTNTKQDAIVAALRKRPGMPLDALAKTIYGDDDEQFIKRLRSLLSRLQDLGRVERTGTNTFKAIAA